MECHMWRLTFGGMSAGMRHRVDHPADGFTYRGRRMESAVAEAIRECLSPGVVSVTPQSAPERIPADHVARCRRDGTSPDRWKRADLTLAFITGTTITRDVRTTDTQCASAASSAAAHLHSLERAKIVKYADDYRAFRPVVIDLGGAVSEVSYESITNRAAKVRPAAPLEVLRVGGATAGRHGADNRVARNSRACAHRRVWTPCWPGPDLGSPAASGRLVGRVQRRAVRVMGVLSAVKCCASASVCCMFSSVQF